MIGIDPHKAIPHCDRVRRDRSGAGPVEGPGRRAPGRTAAGVGERRSRERTWAIESAGGLGYLLAQQLVAAGELVRRCAGHVGGPGAGVELGPVEQERPQRRPFGGGGGVARPVAGRGAAPRTMRRCCRLLVEAPHSTWPGGATSCAAASTLWSPSSCRAGSARKSLSHQALSRCSTSDRARRPPPARAPPTWRSSWSPRSTTSTISFATSRARIDRRRASVGARPSPTSSGSARSWPRMIIGYTGDPPRFATAGHFAAYTGTAPDRVLLRRAGRAPAVAAREPARSTTPCTSPPSPRSATATAPAAATTTASVAEGKTPREAIRALKRRLSDVVWRHLVDDAPRAITS